MFPQLARFSDFGFLLLRFMVGVVFISSGWNDLRDPEKRSKSLGFGKGFTIFLSVAEVAGSLGIMFGVLTQLAALGLIVIGGSDSEEDFRLAHRILGREEHGTTTSCCW
jgi:uncharacterized membrane protein YphA (DoxX/SURF4 family)